MSRRPDLDVDIASDYLFHQFPHFSAREKGMRWQRYFLWCLLLLVGLIGLVGYFFPFILWVLFFIFGGIFLSGVFVRYLPALLTQPPLLFSAYKERSDEDYPIYTILVPLFQEANMLSSLVSRLEKLRWPRSRLDVKLLLEQADNETRMAAERLSLGEGYEIVIVPDQSPRTKGKACNYGLLTARGRFIVIFDAEDEPDPGQLLRAWHVFRECSDRLACVQAPLLFFNMEENWLTRQFALEYYLQFMFFLPFVIRVGLPVFLGGSSNHFRTDVLREIGGWDPYNVTEDADIGLRLRRLGWEVKFLPSWTREEAVCHLGSWVKQRARWIKGWLQTWLVAMRHPRQLVMEIGWKGFLFLQLLVPIYLLSILLHLLIWPVVLLIGFIEPLDGVVMVVAVLSVYVFVIFTARYSLNRASIIKKTSSMMLACLMIPFYWFLLSFAAFRALVQLWRDPYRWEKTRHGMTAYRRKGEGMGDGGA